MAARIYKTTAVATKGGASAGALVGTETIDASVLTGEIAIVIDGAATVNSNILNNIIDQLRDFVSEQNK